MTGGRTPGAGTAWLVTGTGGQLGGDLVRLLADRRADGDSVTGVARADVDLTDADAVRGYLRGWLAAADDRGQRPIVLNAAAYTAVDAAETDEATALTVNGSAPGWLADELTGRGRLVHVSTDYVFGGDAERPYEVDDTPSPRSAYGRTKLAGEQAVLGAGGDSVVVRTAWVYATHGSNFVRTMLRLEGERETVSVVDDQRGNPTWSRDLAAGLVEAALAPVHGVLHATNTGATTWWGLARAVFEAAGADPARVLPTTSAEFSRPAPRPAWSVLSPARWTAAGLAPLPDWQSSVRRCVAEIRAAQ